MGVRNVDQILITDRVSTSPTPKEFIDEFDVAFQWTDDKGIIHKPKKKKYKFPDVLETMPEDIKQAFIEDVILAAARVDAGIDTWEDYR